MMITQDPVNCRGLEGAPDFVLVGQVLWVTYAYHANGNQETDF